MWSDTWSQIVLNHSSSYMSVYKNVSVCICEEDLSYFKLRIYVIAEQLWFWSTSIKKPKSHIEFSFTDCKITWLEKKQARNHCLSEMCGYFRFWCHGEEHFWPLLFCSWHDFRNKAVVSREGTSEFPALLLCRFKH